MANPPKLTSKNWEPGGKKNRYDFTDGDLKIILGKSKIPLDQISERKLKKASQKLETGSLFLDSRRILQGGPLIPNIRTALEEFKHKANDLFTSMNEMDYRTKYDHLLVIIDSEDGKKKAIKNGIDLFDRTQSDVGFLCYLADESIKRLPHGKAGPREDKALKKFIYDLAQNFKYLTGQDPLRKEVMKKIKTQFSDFVYWCYASWCEKSNSTIDQSRSSLAKTIQRLS